MTTTSAPERVAAARVASKTGGQSSGQRWYCAGFEARTIVVAPAAARMRASASAASARTERIAPAPPSTRTAVPERVATTTSSPRAASRRATRVPMRPAPMTSFMSCPLE